MNQSRTVKFSHESPDVAIDDSDPAKNFRSTSQLKHNSDSASASDSKFQHISMKVNVYSVLKRNKILQALPRICKHRSKDNATSFSPSILEDEERKPGSFLFIVTVNRLAKLILIYLNNPVWKYVGVDILQVMHEYRDAWVNLLRAIMKTIKMPLWYTCFLNLLPKAVAQDLASILNKSRRDFLGEETMGIQGTLRRLWRFSAWQYSQLSPEIDGLALRESYNANIRTEDDLLMCLSNIQHFAGLFASGSNHNYTGKDNWMEDSPINMQIDQVKEVLSKMSEARQLLVGKLEFESCSSKSLD